MDNPEAEILKQFINDIIPDLKKVSGNHFGNTIEGEVYPNGKGFEITADAYIRVLIDGRAPTRSGAPKGSPTLQEQLLDWIGKKNITPRPGTNGKTPTVEQMSWAMATSIHRFGTRLYQQGGGNNIFDPIINEQRLSSLFSLMAEDYVNRFAGINLPDTFV